MSASRVMRAVRAPDAVRAHISPRAMHLSRREPLALAREFAPRVLWRTKYVTCTPRAFVRRGLQREPQVAARGWARAGVLLALLLLTGMVACSTRAPIPPAQAVISVEGLRAAQQARTQNLRALRARARVSLNTAQGESFTRQQLLLERPNRLRVSVTGLLGQPLRAFATDGEWLDLYEAGGAGLESAPFSQAFLERWLGLALAPRDVVQWLLATPRWPQNEVPALTPLHGARDGAAWALRFSCCVFRFDRAGQLRAFERAAAAAQPGFRVSYKDWRARPGGAFPFWLRFESTLRGAQQQLTLTLRDLELNPEIAPGVFRLAPQGGQNGLGSPDAENPPAK